MSSSSSAFNAAALAFGGSSALARECSCDRGASDRYQDVQQDADQADDSAPSAFDQGYEFIVQMDGDFSHSPEDVPRLVEAAAVADLVLGSRYCNGIRVINWPLGRLMLSMSAARYVRLILGMPLTDPTGGFKCFRSQALRSIHLETVLSNGYCFQIETTHRLWRDGMKVVEVPIIFTDRFQGTSKMSGGIISEALWRVWVLLLQNGLRRRPRKAPPKTRPPEAPGTPRN